MKRTMLINIIDTLCLILLISSTIYLLAHWSVLPDRLPSHWGWSGRATGWMSKDYAWVHPAIMWGLFILFSLAECFPRLYNTGGIKITDENRDRLYPLMRNALNTCKLLVMALFATLIVDVVHGGKTVPCFVAAFLPILIANVVFWWVKMFRNR